MKKVKVVLSRTPMIVVMEIFKFPFQVEIWGTVSDWFIVLLTGLTAIYLIRTFKSQQRLTQIELQRYIDGLKPFFEASLLRPSVSENEDHLKVGVGVMFKNTGGAAYKVRILDYTPDKNNWKFFSSNPDDPYIFPIKYESENTVLINCSYESRYRNAGAVFSFCIESQDEIGNSYRQTYVYSYHLQEHMLNSDNPTLMGEKIIKL